MIVQPEPDRSDGLWWAKSRFLKVAQRNRQTNIYFSFISCSVALLFSLPSRVFVTSAMMPSVVQWTSCTVKWCTVVPRDDRDETPRWCFPKANKNPFKFNRKGYFEMYKVPLHCFKNKEKHLLVEGGVTFKQLWSIRALWSFIVSLIINKSYIPQRKRNTRNKSLFNVHTGMKYIHQLYRLHAYIWNYIKVWRLGKNFSLH